jgi:outer membrane protein insertion porin family
MGTASLMAHHEKPAGAGKADRMKMTRNFMTKSLLATTAMAAIASVSSAAALPMKVVQAQEPALTVADQIVVPRPPVQADKIESITVVGTQRLEAETVRSYIRLRAGQVWSQESADQALKDLAATELFADFSIRNDNGAVTVEVKENPVVNRIILEGNKRIKEDKINPEIKLAPRQIFSRSKVRADVARIVELYKRQGRFAASVEPKMVQLDQNRVDIVFEITEGPKSKVRQINVIGNNAFSDSELRSEMLTKQSRFFRVLSTGTSYDPDRLAFDQQKMRQFYLTQGYADFRVVSAVAELTPNKEDFIITYVVEEGDRYKFGDVKVDSKIRDFKSEGLTATLPMKKGEWYNAKLVEDTVESLSETAGLFGYAFADVDPGFEPNKEDLTMSITFDVKETPRVFVERIDINGNTITQDKVVRREFRLNEGDAFNSFQVKRTTDKIKSLGYFQEDVEVEQAQGSAADRIVLTTNVEEKPTGQLSLSAGFSSLESFIFQGAITQSNFRGKGQELRTNLSYSRYAKSIELGFTEPYLFDKSIGLSADIFRRDQNSFNFLNNQRNTTYKQTSTGFQLRTGVPVNEYTYFQLRYGLNFDNVTLDQNLFYADTDGNGTRECDPQRAGRFLCDAIGKSTTSQIGYSFVYDNRDSRLRPTRGHSISISQDLAGLGGNVKYIKTELSGNKFFRLSKGGFILGLSAQGGYIRPLQNRGSAANGIDDVRLTDRFTLGEPEIRGFDIRGVGPRIRRVTFTPELVNGVVVNNEVPTDPRNTQDDAIGGRAFYLGRAEIEIPLGSGAKELGLRPSIYVDAGAVFNVTQPLLQSVQARGAPTTTNALGPLQYYAGTQTNGVLDISTTATNANGTARTPVLIYQERFFGNSASPRLSVGFGVNWRSPFGPFRIDIAKALLKQPGDDTKLVSFNVGTQF